MPSNDFNNWTEKYRAQKFIDIKGQELAVGKLKSFFANFPKAKKAIILHGPAGVGKTSLAYVIANEFDLEIYELNASDFRNKEQLEKKLKPSSEQSSLFKKGKVLLVDEIDGLSARDRGGLPELGELIINTKFPMILTANDIWDKKFVEIRKKCDLIDIKDLDYKLISLILQEIVKKEHINVDNQLLLSIAIRAKGDVRAAINDLQTIAHEENTFETYIPLAERNRSQDIFNALKLIFKNLLNEQTLSVYDTVDMPLEKIFLWVEENIPYEYSGEEIYKAYEALSIADVFRGRIRRRRYWRFLVYQNIFLSAGISLSKKKQKLGYTHYQKPTRILKIWMNNNKMKYKVSIVQKYAKATHCSKRKAMKEFNLIKPFLNNPQIQKELKLNDLEVQWLQKIR